MQKQIQRCDCHNNTRTELLSGMKIKYQTSREKECIPVHFLNLRATNSGLADDFS